MIVIHLEFGGYAFDMMLLWFKHGLGLGYDYGFGMVWKRNAFFRVPDGLASRKETETARVDFSRVFIVLIWFWYGFEAIVMWFWYNSDMCSRRDQKNQTKPYKAAGKKNRNHTFDPRLNHNFDPYQNHN
jgi:hypothetical protein